MCFMCFFSYTSYAFTCYQFHISICIIAVLKASTVSDYSERPTLLVSRIECVRMNKTLTMQSDKFLSTKVSYYNTTIFYIKQFIGQTCTSLSLCVQTDTAICC